MKKNISKIWGVGLIVVMLVSLFGLAAPAAAGTLSFSADTTVPSTTDNILGPTGLDILDIAVYPDGNTIYAATGNTSGAQIFKSTDGGSTWTQLTAPTAFTGTVTLVSVAPDDANKVVIFGNAITLTTNLTAYVSTNGGSTWSTLGTVSTAVAIYDIDISPASAGTNYIAAAGTDTAGENDDPGLYYFNLGAAAPVWKNAVSDSGWLALDPVEVDAFRAVKFSPNFAADQVATAVSATTGNGTAGALSFHMLSFNQSKWNSPAGFGTSYPKALDSYTGAGTYTINNAAIALAPDYLGSDDTTRIAFVGASITGAAGETGGIYRLKDTSLKELKSDTGIFSVGYDGTTLIAGQTASNDVLRSADALGTDPTVSSSRSMKRPGGASNVAVAFAGTKVVAATSGTSSAFAVSTNNGLSFNDISLIDTALTSMVDIWATADGAKIYLLSNDGTTTSLWRKASAWQRVFFVTGTGTTKYIVRGAMNNNDVLFIADVGGTVMYYSTDAAETRWFQRASRYTITDLAVESTDVSYVAVGASVSKSTNGGFTWGTSVATKLASGTANTLQSLGDGKLIVGSTAGYISYSTDSGATWTKMEKQIESSATGVQVTASGLASGDYIYAASAKSATKVLRWQIGTSIAWTDMAAPTVTGQGATGMVLQGGNLFVCTANATDSLVVRTLGPTASSVTWSSITSTAAFNTTNAFRASSGSTVLRAIDTEATPDALHSYTDTLAAAGPTLVTPANAFKNPVNSVTGRSVDIAFSWTKPSDSVTQYDIEIYTDAAATERIQQNAVASTASQPVVLMGPYQTGGAPTGSATVEFSPGKTYYWRVRVSPRNDATKGPVYSQWSELRSFTIEPGVALVPSILSPLNGNTGVSRTPSFSWQPISGTTQYQFILANNPTLTAPIVDAKVTTTAYSVVTPLNYGVTYFWRVKPLAPVVGDWSAISNFTVMEAPGETTPAVVITQVPAPVFTLPPQPAPTTIVIPPAPAPPAPIAPVYIWAIIIIGAILVIAVIVLIVRTRRAV